jgi:hypothetical protein
MEWRRHKWEKGSYDILKESNQTKNEGRIRGYKVENSE